MTVQPSSTVSEKIIAKMRAPAGNWDSIGQVDGDEAIVGPFHWAEETPLFAAPQPASNAGGTEAALKMVAALFAESVHETYTREEVVSIVEDMIRVGRSTSSIPSTSRASPVMQAAEKAARVVDRWSDAKKEYAERTMVVGRVTGKIHEGEQVRGMPGAICHACGLKDYPCANPDCPNKASEVTSTDGK